MGQVSTWMGDRLGILGVVGFAFFLPLQRKMKCMYMYFSGQNMRQPGIEPGSTAWKAAMLTTIPLTLALGQQA